MQLDAGDLRLVDAIKEEGSLTRAGNVLFLTQSALSRQLADLERRLGAPLFQRSGRRMVATPAGERLIEAGREILDALARAEADAREAAGKAEALLRFSTECYTCYHWLPRVLTEFQSLYPRVEPRIVAAATRRPIQALLKGQIDLAVVSCPARNRRVSEIPLFRDELAAVVPAGHPWASRPYVVAEDFVSEHVLLYSGSRADSTLFRDVLDPARVTPERVSRVELTEAILELVRAGMGVSLLARWAVEPCVRSGHVVAVRVTKRGLHRQWSAATLARTDPPGHLKGFIDLLTAIKEPPASMAGWRAGSDEGMGDDESRGGSAA